MIFRIARQLVEMEKRLRAAFESERRMNALDYSLSGRLDSFEALVRSSFEASSKRVDDLTKRVRSCESMVSELRTILENHTNRLRDLQSQLNVDSEWHAELRQRYTEHKKGGGLWNPS